MTDFEKKLGEIAQTISHDVMNPILRSRISRTEAYENGMGLYKSGARFGYRQGTEDAAGVANKYRHADHLKKGLGSSFVNASADVILSEVRSLLPSNPPEDQL